jgi:signal peptidase I
MADPNPPPLPTQTAAAKPAEGWRESVKSIVFILLVVLGVRSFVFEPFNIPSGSMLPTLLVGDFVVVSKFSYGFSQYSLAGHSWIARGLGTVGVSLPSGRIFASVPERGDVVVFKLPTDNATDYIKRVVGLPGDRIQVTGGILHINGTAVRRDADGTFIEEPGRPPTQRYVETLPNGRRHHILEQSDSGWLDNTPEYLVPAGHVFAMGDNRDNSADSRVLNSVGYIPLDNLVGRARFLFLSVDDSARLLAPWTWPGAVRFERLLDAIDSDVPPRPAG